MLTPTTAETLADRIGERTRIASVAAEAWERAADLPNSWSPIIRSAFRYAFSGSFPLNTLVAQKNVVALAETILLTSVTGNLPSAWVTSKERLEHIENLARSGPPPEKIKLVVEHHGTSPEGHRLCMTAIPGLPGYTEIDLRVSSFVVAVNQAGFTTTGSCGGGGTAYIEISPAADLVLLVSMLGAPTVAKEAAVIVSHKRHPNTTRTETGWVAEHRVSERTRSMESWLLTVTYDNDDQPVRASCRFPSANLDSFTAAVNTPRRSVR